MTIIDDDAFQRLLGELGPATFEDALRVFLAAIRTAQIDLGSCAARGDTAALARIAHKVKSSSLIFGGREVTALAKRIEALVDGDPERGLVQAAALADALRRLDSALEAYLRTNEHAKPAPGPDTGTSGPAGPVRSP